MASALVAVVLAAGLVTAILPVEGQDLVFRTPLLIGILVTGTTLVLWRILRDPDR